MESHPGRPFPTKALVLWVGATRTIQDRVSTILPVDAIHPHPLRMIVPHSVRPEAVTVKVQTATNRTGTGTRV